MTMFSRLFGAVAMLLMMSGCATGGHPQDPMEGFNRAMFKFNDVVDKAALRPAATAYQTVLPNFVQAGIGNFFGNLGDVSTGLNNLLQGKIKDGASDFLRVGLNTTVGVIGLFDIASEIGLPKHEEDFGQTLGRWGMASGPYVVLPFLGSSTLRDVGALPVDISADAWSYKRPVFWRNVGTAIRGVDRRAALLDASNLVEDAALDPYEFIRDAYLQRRQNRVYDGDPPATLNQDNGDSPDTGNKDTGNKDTGNKDAGNKDAGNRDAGNRDAGNRDAGNKDTGNKDTGNKD